MRYKSNTGVNDDSKITAFTSMWVHVAGKMELLVTDMGMSAQGHVNFGNYIIHPKADDNGELYIEFQSSGERLGLQMSI